MPRNRDSGTIQFVLPNLPPSQTHSIRSATFTDEHSGIPVSGLENFGLAGQCLMRVCCRPSRLCSPAAPAPPKTKPATSKLRAGCKPEHGIAGIRRLSMPS